NSQHDQALKSELIAHPKERAEHIMLIDLERNDLGRICQPGSVKVDELMTMESYAHVHHIVSNVRGQLREDITPAQVIRAVFPGGTITGCPKERCMAIIAELEQEARGAYTGSMGYLNLNGDMDLNILIRTITLDEDHITLRAGAGLVADSDAQKELQETAHKARGMLLAIGEQA
ncbi:MAG TPA: aminodeoxychorismate synthase, component I, partial [Gammaproteobacteria bacterium]|nr:aminodeoxychorismate synthase, component I [Gammaproteobacteria bacterium]